MVSDKKKGQIDHKTSRKISKKVNISRGSQIPEFKLIAGANER